MVDLSASEIMKIVDRLIAEMPEDPPRVADVLKPPLVVDQRAIDFSMTLPIYSAGKWRDYSLEYQYDLLEKLARVVPTPAHSVDHAGGDSRSCSQDR